MSLFAAILLVFLLYKLYSCLEEIEIESPLGCGCCIILLFLIFTIFGSGTVDNVSEIGHGDSVSEVSGVESNLDQIQKDKVEMELNLNSFLEDKFPLLKVKIEKLKVQQSAIGARIAELDDLKSEMENSKAIALLEDKIRQLEDKKAELSRGIDNIYLYLERIYAMDKVSDIRDSSVKMKEITTKADELITEAEQIQTDIKNM